MKAMEAWKSTAKPWDLPWIFHGFSNVLLMAAMNVEVFSNPKMSFGIILEP